MSSGIKNLQGAARAFTRLERLEAGQPVSYDDDSGIEGIGLTPVDEMEHHYSSPTASSGGRGHSTSGSSTASHPAYHSSVPMHSQDSSVAMHAQGSYPNYYAGAGAGDGGAVGGGHHGYPNSSVPSSLAAAHGAAGGPYLDHADRMSSVDMGISRLIHRQPTM